MAELKLKSNVAGTTMQNNRKGTVLQLPEDAILDLIAEPENEYDSEAIKVEYKGAKIGYMAKADPARDKIKDKLPIKARMTTVSYKHSGSDKKYAKMSDGAIISCVFSYTIDYTETPTTYESKEVELEKKAVIGGGVIWFDEPSHVYWSNKEGDNYFNQLHGVSSIIEAQVTKEFDSKGIASNTAKSLNIKESKEIENCWSSNNLVSTLLGTALHLAMEHYFKYRWIGQRQKELGKTKDYSMPTNAIADYVIGQYLTQVPIPSYAMNIFNEAVVKHGVMIGTCDRLDQDGEVFALIDYKFNGNKLYSPKEFKKGFSIKGIPHTVLGTYYIQLNLYRWMAEEALGMECAAMYVDAYDGNDWVREEVPRIDVHEYLELPTKYKTK